MTRTRAATEAVEDMEDIEDVEEIQDVEEVGDGELEADAAAEDSDEKAVEDEEPSRRAIRLPAVLIAIAVLLAGTGGWLTWQTVQVRSAGSAENLALVDPAATAEVTAAVTTALNRVFSYSYDKTEVTERAAAESLRGKALDTYRQLFAEVRELAPQQKLVLTTRVVSSAVQELTADRATLLVFLDQSATRADRNTTSAAAAQLSITAEREGDTWVITRLQPR